MEADQTILDATEQIRRAKLRIFQNGIDFAEYSTDEFLEQMPEKAKGIYREFKRLAKKADDDIDASQKMFIDMGMTYIGLKKAHEEFMTSHNCRGTWWRGTGSEWDDVENQLNGFLAEYMQIRALNPLTEESKAAGKALKRAAAAANEALQTVLQAMSIITDIELNEIAAIQNQEDDIAMKLAMKDFESVCPRTAQPPSSGWKVDSGPARQHNADHADGHKGADLDAGNATLERLLKELEEIRVDADDLLESAEAAFKRAEELSSGVKINLEAWDGFCRTSNFPEVPWAPSGVASEWSTVRDNHQEIAVQFMNLKDEIKQSSDGQNVEQLIKTVLRAVEDSYNRSADAFDRIVEIEESYINSQLGDASIHEEDDDVDLNPMKQLDNELSKNNTEFDFEPSANFDLSVSDNDFDPILALQNIGANDEDAPIDAEKWLNRIQSLQDQIQECVEAARNNLDEMRKIETMNELNQFSTRIGYPDPVWHHGDNPGSSWNQIDVGYKQLVESYEKDFAHASKDSKIGQSVTSAMMNTSTALQEGVEFTDRFYQRLVEQFGIVKKRAKKAELIEIRKQFNAGLDKKEIDDIKLTGTEGKSMKKKAIIFGADKSYDVTKFDSWMAAEKAIRSRIGTVPFDLSLAKKIQKDTARNRDMHYSAYFLIGVIGDQVVMRLRQDRWIKKRVTARNIDVGIIGNYKSLAVETERLKEAKKTLTLDSVLGGGGTHNEFLQSFFYYCRNYNVENIEFYLKTDDMTKLNDENFKELATTYVLEHSRKEINISSSTRNDCTEAYNQGNYDQIDFARCREDVRKYLSSLFSQWLNLIPDE